MEFVVTDIGRAPEFVFDKPWAAISVATYSEDWPNLFEENRLGLLQLSFHDIDEHIYGYRLMSEVQALQILEFVDTVWNKIETLLIHCEAGISRSPAIAAAISRIKLGHEGGYFRTHVPNRYVYNTLLKVNENRKRS